MVSRAIFDLYFKGQNVLFCFFLQLKTTGAHYNNELQQLLVVNRAVAKLPDTEMISVLLDLHLEC